MITIELPAETVQFIYQKLDQVGGTRQVCNFLENEVSKYQRAQAQVQEPKQGPGNLKE